MTAADLMQQQRDAELATLRARVEALEGALRQIGYGEFNCSPRQYGMAMQEHARAALESAP